MTKKIIIYSTSWCGDCHRLKGQLMDRGIPFEERDIEKSEVDYKTMLGYTNGKRVIPTVDIDGKILINPTFAQVTQTLQTPDPL